MLSATFFAYSVSIQICPLARPRVVDDADAAPLPPAFDAPADLPDAARPLDQVAGLRVGNQRLLELRILVVGELPDDELGEKLGLDEGQHAGSLYVKDVLRQ